jgi:hypothetical protein
MRTLTRGLIKLSVSVPKIEAMTTRRPARGVVTVFHLHKYFTFTFKRCNGTQRQFIPRLNALCTLHVAKRLRTLTRRAQVQCELPGCHGDSHSYYSNVNVEMQRPRFFKNCRAWSSSSKMLICLCFEPNALYMSLLSVFPPVALVYAASQCRTGCKKYVFSFLSK